MRDFRSERYNNNRPRRDYTEQQGSNNNQVVGVVFREPVHQVLKKVKNESFFKWPNKMIGNPEKRNWNSIVNTIETMVTLPRIAEVYRITWTNLSEKANWNSCCITLVVWVVRPILGRTGRILQDPLSELSTLFLRRLTERGHTLLE